MHRSLILSLALAACLLAPPNAAATPRDDVAARHALEREAHMDRNVDLLLSLFADDFVIVDGGEVQQPTRAQQNQRFATYFGSVRFRKWDDLVPPAIRLSADGTLATVIVQKEVVLVSAEAPEDAPAERAVFAWMETWERRRGRWMLVAMCSTRAPEPSPSD